MSAAASPLPPVLGADTQDEGRVNLHLQIGTDYFVQVPGTQHHERPPPFDDDEDGEFKGNGNAYRGDPGSWFVSQASRKIDYTDYCKSRYRPGDFPAMLTRKDFRSSSLSLWHDSPLPLPHKFAEPHPCSIRFKMSGGAVRKMPWLQLDGQVFELHGTSTKVIKHFLGGRVSLIIEQLQWEGPWSAMMSSATRLRYTELFRKMDVDNSGTVDGGELSFAFEQLGIEIDEATIMQMVSKHSKKHAAEREVTINEFFELMESQSHNGRAWFVTAACVLIPSIDYDHEILAYREEQRKAEFDRKVQRVFDELEENDAIKPQQIEEALRELDLHMDARKLSSLLSDLGNEPVPLQQFIMLIENQHVMDMGSAAKVLNKAAEQRKLEQVNIN